MTTHTTKTPKYVIIGLVILGLIPALGGPVRIAGFAGVELMETGPRYDNHVISITTHILCSIGFWFLGLFQFSKAFRNRNRRRHKILGRLWVLLALIVALTGLWLTLTFPPAHNDGFALYVIRLIVSLSMLFAIVWGVCSILNRRVAQHEAWMMRAYALGMGAGTQALIGIPFFILFGEPDTGLRSFLMGFGWALNVMVVEAVLWRRKNHQR